MLQMESFSSVTIEEAMSLIDWSEQIKKYLLYLSYSNDTFNRWEAKIYLEDIVANDAGIDYYLENSNISWEQHALNRANELWIEYSAQEYYDGNTTLILTDIREELGYIWEYTAEEIEYAIQNMETN